MKLDTGQRLVVHSSHQFSPLRYQFISYLSFLFFQRQRKPSGVVFKQRHTFVTTQACRISLVQITVKQKATKRDTKKQFNTQQQNLWSRILLEYNCTFKECRWVTRNMNTQINHQIAQQTSQTVANINSEHAEHLSRAGRIHKPNKKTQLFRTCTVHDLKHRIPQC